MRDTNIPQWILDACQCSKETPLRKATFEVFSNAIDAETALAIQPGVQDGERQFRAGRLASIVELKADLEAIFEEANNPEKEGD